MLRREGEDVAGARGGLRLEEGRGEVLWLWLAQSRGWGFVLGLTLIVLGRRGVVLGLRLLHGAVVVDKDKGVRVLRVLVTLRPRVPGAQVALEPLVSTEVKRDAEIETLQPIPWGHSREGQSSQRPPAGPCRRRKHKSRFSGVGGVRRTATASSSGEATRATSCRSAGCTSGGRCHSERCHPLR